MKEKYSDFWVDGEKEAWIVRHNYHSNRFLSMISSRQSNDGCLNATTGERGYTVTTSRVNYEFGFALRNKMTGEWITEIGTPQDESPLFRDHCTQRLASISTAFSLVRAIQLTSNTFSAMLSPVCLELRRFSVYVPLFGQLYTGIACNVLLTFKSNTAKLFTCIVR